MEEKTENYLRLLKLCSLLNEFSEEDLTVFANSMRSVEYKKGDPIFLKDEISQNIYFVVSGTIDVVKDSENNARKVVKTFKTNDYFSELSVLTNSRHSVSSFATEDSVLATIDGPQFMESLRSHPTAAHSLIKQLASKTLKTLTESNSMRGFDESFIEFNPRMIDILPPGLIKKHKVLPVRISNSVFEVAAVLPLSPEFYTTFEKLNPGLNLLISALEEADFVKLSEKFIDVYKGIKKNIETQKNPFFPKNIAENVEDFLKFSITFSQLPAKLLNQIYPHFKLQKYKPGEIIVDGGQVCDNFTLVQSGQLEVTKKIPGHSLYCHVENLKGYDSIGEANIISDTPHLLRVTALTDASVYHLPKKIFAQLFPITLFSVPLGIAMASRLQALNLLKGIDFKFDQNSSTQQNLLKLGTTDQEKILEEVLTKASDVRASDIHFEQSENSTIIRYRIDGDLVQIWEPLPKKFGDILTNRIKILSKLDISERRLPQDGQFNFQIGSAKINFRVSTLPSRYGEKSVLRLIKTKNTVISLNQLAPDIRIIKFLNSLIRYRQGLFLVAGPTGSGKTTTLYSLLNQIDRTKCNVMTIEDPIELELANTNQIQVFDEIGLGFDTILRSVLRQDPDIILVGEIRDKKSMEMVFQAALTGRLVLATIHASSSVEIITRLLDLGATYEQIASVMLGAMSQRLVKTTCSSCATTRPINKREVSLFNHYLKNEKYSTQISYGKGCPKCNHTGFSGRVPLFEFWKKTDAVRDALMMKSGVSNILSALNADGFENLGVYGLKLAAKGYTTIDEVETTLFGLCDFSLDEASEDGLKLASGS